MSRPDIQIRTVSPASSQLIMSVDELARLCSIARNAAKNALAKAF
jgi:hypothetical protein